MSYLIKPKNYKPLLDLKQTELGIKQIKEFFQLNLSSELRLRRVTAPLFVLKGMGINDDLNGIERPVSFPIKDLGDAQAEVVHSLAKWKRLTLADLACKAQKLTAGKAGGTSGVPVKAVELAQKFAVVQLHQPRNLIILQDVVPETRKFLFAVFGHRRNL